MQRFPLFKIYSRPPADVTKGLHSLTSRPKSGKRPTLTTFARLGVLGSAFLLGCVSKRRETPSGGAFLRIGRAQEHSWTSRARSDSVMRKNAVYLGNSLGFETQPECMQAQNVHCNLSNVCIYLNNNNRFCCRSCMRYAT